MNAVKSVFDVENLGIVIFYLVVSHRAWLLIAFGRNAEYFAFQTYVQRENVFE